MCKISAKKDTEMKTSIHTTHFPFVRTDRILYLLSSKITVIDLTLEQLTVKLQSAQVQTV